MAWLQFIEFDSKTIAFSVFVSESPVFLFHNLNIVVTYE